MDARTSRLAAMAAATVQERSGGRHILGVGTGGSAPGALGRLRATTSKRSASWWPAAPPAPTLRLPLPAPVPIWIAALGPKAVRLAGEIADGVILNWCTPERVAEARDAIRAAAGEAGRDPDAGHDRRLRPRVLLGTGGRGACAQPPASTPRTRPTPGSSRRWA